MTDPLVWHFVLVRAGRPPATGERLASLVLPPELAARVPRAALDRAVELERQRWARVAISNGYIDGWGVIVHRERGFRRSIFPAAALPALTSTPQLVTPGGTH